MEEKMQAVPSKFWASVSNEEFTEIINNDGVLNEELCARLWRMEDRQGEPPKRLEILIKRDQFEKLLDKVTGKK